MYGLKTIDGLEKVDVILRRVDDSYCDPLELKSDSLLGVPGLVQAVRKGNVAIANPLGSSIVENAGLVPFLPAICQTFFWKRIDNANDCYLVVRSAQRNELCNSQFKNAGCKKNIQECSRHPFRY